MLGCNFPSKLVYAALTKWRVRLEDCHDVNYVREDAVPRNGKEQRKKGVIAVPILGAGDSKQLKISAIRDLVTRFQ